MSPVCLSEKSKQIYRDWSYYTPCAAQRWPSGFERTVSGSLWVILRSHRDPRVSRALSIMHYHVPSPQGCYMPPAICSSEHSVIQVISMQRNRSRSRKAVRGSKEKLRGRDFFSFFYRLLQTLQTSLIKSYVNI